MNFFWSQMNLSVHTYIIVLHFLSFSVCFRDIKKKQDKWWRISHHPGWTWRGHFTGRPSPHTVTTCSKKDNYASFIVIQKMWKWPRSLSSDSWKSLSIDSWKINKKLPWNLMMMNDFRSYYWLWKNIPVIFLQKSAHTVL